MRSGADSQFNRAIYVRYLKRTTVHLGYVTQHLPVTIKFEHKLLFAAVYRAGATVMPWAVMINLKQFERISLKKEGGERWWFR